MANVISEDKKTIKRPNNVILENRRMLLISGVTDVGSFDEQTVVVFTELGELTIKGTSLHVDRLNLEIGEIALSAKKVALKPRKSVFAKDLEPITFEF
jgi:sporulation protein YabP